MLQLFHTMLRSPCSNDASGLTKQMFAQLSIAWVRGQNFLLHFWQQSLTQCLGVRALGAACLPIRLTPHDKPHQPKSSSIASAFPQAASRRSWPHRDLEVKPRGLEPPAPGPKYRPKFGRLGHLSSSPRRSRAVPFFRCLDTLQDSGTCLRMTTSRFSHMKAQTVVNKLPSSVQPPVAKVGVDGLPRRKIMGQEAPLATSAQDIEDGIDNLSPQMVSRKPSTFN